ncbi:MULTISPECIES: exodeoxyribonuclease VII large subunit [Caballeronia]|uniref:exodeoxyribonuclease VII large subunit n=1 Tax=Caballeronia TaxID=1827195 RepID=UPI001FD09CA5|nr:MULTISPECIES: exodeoxyribonuclease VII large subunit [Caballeronia]MDR5799087.1 exodeoxyribonuclease VII large subunit [Caballeronia sp. LZ001]
MNQTPDTNEEQRGESLSFFLKKISTVIQQHADEAWVVAEISSLSSSRGAGHVYLDLVEHDDAGQEIAKVRANMWAGAKQAVLGKFEAETGSKLEAGMKVLLRVAPTFHIQFGLAVIVKDIEPSFTVGDMQRKLAKIRADLAASGVIDWNRNRNVPGEFARIAVISPQDAAGLGDFKSQADILEDAGLCSFEYFHARFQGKGAPDEIVSAMRAALIRNRDAAQGRHYDALVIIRGGGSAADLAHLNDFAIANAICRTPLPVMVGIGHERDSVILDEVACYSAHTPSKLIAYITSIIFNNAQAAMRDWQFITAFAMRSVAVAQEATEAQIQAVKVGGQKWLELAEVRSLSHIEMVTATAKASLVHAEQRISSSLETICMSANHLLDTAKREAQNAFATVIGMGPKRTLERGFVITRHAGKAVSRMEQARSLSDLELEFSDGRIAVSIVSDVTNP